MTATIRFGVIGAGYMGKAHTIAIQTAGTVFALAARPVAEMIATSSEDSAERAAAALGFRRHTGDWRRLVADAEVDAVVICTPTYQHREMALAAIAHGKHVLCEKPLAMDSAEAAELVEAAERAGVINHVGFNYARSPAAQLARELIAEGALGDVYHFRGTHAEDFLADPTLPMSWRLEARYGSEAGALSDLGSHIVNLAHYLCGPLSEVMAQRRTVHTRRPLPDREGDAAVENDDQVDMLVRFAAGPEGTLHASRVATGRKMGLTFEVTGTDGALVFDQERLGELHYYRCDDGERTGGFRRILVSPAHPDYGHFCPGAGHGVGYNDMMTIEIRDLVAGILGEGTAWPTFRDAAHTVAVVDAALAASRTDRWQTVTPGGSPR